jgi:hypothetical protein
MLIGSNDTHIMHYSFRGTSDAYLKHCSQYERVHYGCHHKVGGIDVDSGMPIVFDVDSIFVSRKI